MVAGVALSVLSAVFYNVGFVTEKHAVERLPEIHARRSLHMLRTLAGSRRWLGGFALIMAGLACQVLALSLAPISVVQPIFASGIVVLLVLSRRVLHERLGRAELVGVGSVILSLVFVGMSLDKTTDTVGLAGSIDRIVVAALPTAALAAVAFVLAGRLPMSGAPLYGIASGLLYGVGSLGIKGASTIVEKHGLVGAVPRLLVSPDLYLFVVFSALGLLAFQTGLQRCRVSLLAPISNVLSSGYLVAVGTVIFGEHLPAEPWRLAFRLAGFAGIAAGMCLLARGDALAPGFGAGPAEGIDLGLAAVAEVKAESAEAAS